ncbi:MAG: PAS domain-containing protein [Bacteroidales bacterium]|nr:PAS domain-containing protein [Bacteroidales bacterium]
MSEKNSQNIIFRTTISGFIVGIFTVFFVLIVDFFIKGISFSEIIQLHTTNPVYIILDLTPFVLAIYAYLGSKKYAQSIKVLNNALKFEFDKNHKVFKFIESIKMGKIDAKYNLQDSNDVLGQSILDLRDNLKKNKGDEEKRREEDKQRNWISEGLAKFGAILRQDTDDINELSYNLISNLVRYINANQGAFFVIENENGKYLQMTASYAYDRRKYADKRVEWGDGLISAAVQEKETIHMTDIPKTYVHITSGLGESTPRSLIIVPLKINDEVHGVVEIGSLYEIDKYIIEFVEKVAESIASTISNVKINSQTAKLLEESQQQAETLAAQEEQMRQNMEELQATQEEAARQSEQFITFTNAVNHTLIRAEYDANGNLLYANTKFLKKLGYEKNSDVEGKNISMFINDKDQEWFNELWTDLINGGKHFEGDMKHVTRQGRDLWTMSTYTSMKSDSGKVDKVLFLAIDTTEQKKQSLDHQAQINALNTSSIKVEFLPTGDLLECNSKFVDFMQYSLYELKEKSIFDFIDKSELNTLRKIWNDIAKGKSWEGILRQRTKDDENIWVRVSLTPVFDMYNELSKVIYIGKNETKQKLMEIEAHKQTNLLMKQEKELQEHKILLKEQLKIAKEEVKQNFKEIERAKIFNERTLEGAADAIFTFNQDGIIQFFNKAAEELWNIEREIVLGKSVEKLFNSKNLQNDFVRSLVEIDAKKIIGERKEITIYNNNDEELPVIIILSMAQLENKINYTAFIQNISVDLF